MTNREVVEKNIDLVEQYYPGLRISNKYEWNHKVAWLSWLDTDAIGQKRTTSSNPVSEDTIGILDTPMADDSGEFQAVFEAVDLINGTSGAIQWHSFGKVNQVFVIPNPADVSAIDNNTNPNNPPPVNTGTPYWGDEKSDYLGGLLEYDYKRANQTLNAQSARWVSRVFHSAYFGPEGIPLGLDAAITKHRPEWCEVLKVPVV